TVGNGTSVLPRVSNLRLAIDVAACDNQPLVVLFGTDAAALKTLEQRLIPLAWRPPFLGRFIYVHTALAREIKELAGARVEAGVLVVQPDQFGLKGTVLAQIRADADRTELVECLQQGMTRHQRVAKDFGSHVGMGHQQGIFWETVIPVTDPMELKARERGR